MCGTLERLFFSLYPSSRKVAETAEGDWLRRMLFVAMIIHAGLAAWALALIGFVPMILNLLQLAWSYSCYLTLREREVLVYMILLLGQFIYNMCCLLGTHDGDEDLTSIQQLGKMVSAVLCVLLGYTVGKAYYDFRKSGGLHGDLKGGEAPLLIEDRIADQVSRGVNAAEGHVNSALDKQDDEEYHAAR